MSEPKLRKFDHWVYREQPAQKNPARLLLLLHGWTGDENSMIFFASRIPGDYWMLSPRAPYPAPQGYSWRTNAVLGAWPTLEDFRPSAESLLKFVDDWAVSTGVDTAQVDLAGFSQGAALTCTMALLHPQRVRRLAVLSGFVPAGAEELIRLRPLEGKPVFVAHGSQDELVPLERARQSITLLEKAGAQVEYCQSEIGHKVGVECLKGLETFF